MFELFHKYMQSAVLNFLLHQVVKPFYNNISNNENAHKTASIIIKNFKIDYNVIQTSSFNF